MLTNYKKHKEVKFHKVKTNNFNKAKKFDINKSLNEMIIKENISTITKRDKRDSIKTSVLDNFAKNVSILRNKNLFKKPNNKLENSNLIKLMQFKEILKKINKTQREKKKRVGIKIPLKLKQNEKDEKDEKGEKGEKGEKQRKISFNKNVKYCRTFDNNFFNNKNIYENEKNTFIINNNSNRTKKSRKSKDNKEEKKINDETLEKERIRTENITKTIKKKCFCCL